MRPPPGYWQENSCLPLRMDMSSGTWGLPIVTAEEVIFGLPKEDYAKLDYENERPVNYFSFDEKNAGWTDEPQVQILVAARKEIGCWLSGEGDLAEALSTIWPQLELGFSLTPGRPCEALPQWRKSFLTIKPPRESTTPENSRGSSRASTSGTNSPYFATGVADGGFVPLM